MKPEAITNSSWTLSLPVEPPVGAIVEILDGENKGGRYKRDSEDEKGWRRLGYTSSGDDPYSWSEIWWAVTEDGSGGTSVKVTIPDPNDPHPRPWKVTGSQVCDALGDVVPLHLIVLQANRAALQ